MDSPHLGHSQNLEQWDWGGEEQVYSKDAPHLDPLSSSIPFSPFPLLIAVVEEVTERGRMLWRGGEMFSGEGLEQKRRDSDGKWGSVPLGFRLGSRNELVGWLLAHFGLDIY